MKKFVDNVLSPKKVKVTFFVNGENYHKISQNPYKSYIKHAFNKGHQIANHGYKHLDLVLSSTDVYEEITTLDNAIHKIIGKKPAFTRPPFGNYNDRTIDEIQKAGHRSVSLWNLDTNDGKGDNAFTAFKEALAVKSSLKDSFVVLMHEHIDQNLKRTQQIIDYGESKGYKFVTMAKCVGDSKGGYQ
jgi:peptidoglycan/xylan/chitin deacetylase (PgdA/CDA1 family)